MSSRRSYRSLPLAAIAGLALLVTGVAQAQPGSGGGGRGGGWMMGGGFGGGRSAFTPEFTRADMTTLVVVLRLDDTQVSIA